jgi:hypothetical protein
MQNATAKLAADKEVESGDAARVAGAETRNKPGAAARPALQADVGLAVSASALQRRGRGRSGSSCSSAQLARQVLVKMPAWREREETGGEMGHWCFWQSGMWGPGLLGSPLRKVEKKERRGDFPENFGES